MELDSMGRPVKPVRGSVRIFNEPLLPAKSGGVGEPKKGSRRLARQQRKGYKRRSRRLKRIAELGQHLGLDLDAVHADKGQRIHEIRAQAAVSEITLADLLRVFLKMAKRRGYSGGFKVVDGSNDKEKGVMQTGIQSLSQILDKGGYKTLGQYLADRIRSGKHLRLKEDGLFADRHMLECEFKQIWKTQETHHPVLKNKHNGKPLQEHFHRAIIEQRPCKSPAPMVGNCSLEPMLPRAPMAQPAMQAFRMEKQISDLRWGISRSAWRLSSEQRQVVREELETKKEMTFNALYKALKKAGCPGPEDRTLNLAQGDREILIGDRTAAAMKRMGLLDEWKDLAKGNQVSVINLLADAGSPEVFDSLEWDKKLRKAKPKAKDKEEKTMRQVRPEVSDFINKMVDTKKFDVLLKMGFDSGRAGYSIKALNKIVTTMKEQETDERDAIDLVYPDLHNTGRQSQLRAKLPKHDRTGNTVVDVALGQVRREVNIAIAELGATPCEIIIELSRDMKTGLKTRGEITKKMRRNERDRKWAAEQIENHTGKVASPSQIRRYLLWTEQEQKYCPYCENPINCSDAINGHATEYEHILPKSLTRIGNKRDFLVLAHKSCNQEKENKTPWQTWGRDAERWNLIKRRAQRFEDGYKVTINGIERNIKLGGKARQMLVKDFDPATLDDGVIGEFTDRQFQESAWIAKACGKWLRSICSDVAVSRGLLTAHLRRAWKLDTVIPEVRYEEKMPVFDEDYQANKAESDQEACKISKEDFDRYRLYWEGQRDVDKNNRTHRRLNKRIDHRHHMIDAFVIALTNRGLYQRMATHYKQVADSGERKLRLYAEPGLKNIRTQALTMVRKCKPSHRSDRWLAGAVSFKDNPRVVRQQNGKGEKFYAQRKNLIEFLKDKRGESLSRKIRTDILHDSTREILIRELDSIIHSGGSPEQALGSIHHPQWGPGGPLIKKVLVKSTTKAPDAKRKEHGNRNPKLYQYLEPDGYAYLELEFDDNLAKIRPRLVRLHEAREPNGNVRMYKGDTVKDKNGKQYVIRQFKAEGPAIFLSPVTESVADIGKVKAPRKKTVSNKAIKKFRLV